MEAPQVNRPYTIQFEDDDWDDPSNPPPTYTGIRGTNGRWRIDGVDRWTYADEEIRILKESAVTGYIATRTATTLAGEVHVTTSAPYPEKATAEDAVAKWKALDAQWDDMRNPDAIMRRGIDTIAYSIDPA